MKRSFFIVLLAFAGSALAFSSPCAIGSLASYITLGASGCTVGSNTFFDFATVSGISRATEIPTSSVSVSPLGGSFDPGLTVTVNVSASADTLFEAIFTYRITGGSYTANAISLSNSSQTGDGAVTDTQNFCAGGTFGPDGVTGCTGKPGALVAVNGVQNSDSAQFTSVSLLSITDDFVIDGGTAGTANGGTFTDRFSSVPEPSSAFLLTIATAVAVSLKFGQKRGDRPGNKEEV